MDIVNNDHPNYLALVTIWEANRKPRRITQGSIEYSAVKDNDMLKFVPVGYTGGFGGGYSSETFSGGAAQPQPILRNKTPVGDDGTQEGPVSS